MNLMRPQQKLRSMNMHIGLYLSFLQTGSDQLPPRFASQITQACVTGVIE